MRWVICAMLFLAATINYVDRQVIGLLKPTLQQQFTWSEVDYANIVFAFQLAYAIGYGFAGRIIDRSTKRGFALRFSCGARGDRACRSPGIWRSRGLGPERAGSDLFRLGRGIHRRPFRAGTG
jgi:ACS family hexuronate transporter-like MFS transporter